MKFQALLCAVVVLGMAQSASAGVIKKQDPCRPVYATKRLPKVIVDNCTPTKNGPVVLDTVKKPNGSMNDTFCLPKKVTRCPPVLMTVLNGLKKLPRCAPRPPICVPKKVDTYRPSKRVDCYVPRRPKKVVCAPPAPAVNGSANDVYRPCPKPSLRDCKPTYGGSSNGPVICPPRNGGGGGYSGGGNPTPEPASIALAAMGAAGAIARMRRRREAPEQQQA